MRRRLERIFRAGLAAVAPDAALRRHVRREGDALHVDGETWPLPERGRVLVMGAGKGAAPLAKALEELLGERIAAGAVIVKYDHVMPLERIRLFEAAHPVPDAAGQAAAAELLGLARQATAEDLVICLFTGGASALTPAPVAGVTLEDMRTLTESLLACGADIGEINALRKHLSRFGGGRLAQAAAPARVLCFLVSDVIGDDMGVIASGPTAPDASTYGDCLRLVERYGLVERLPEGVRRSLREGAAGRLAETPKADEPLFGRVRNVLVAANGQALDAAAAEARALGFRVCVRPAPYAGEARECAVRLLDEALAQAAAAPGAAPLCYLAGGECTVSLHGTGRGGRNQEMALAASLALRERPEGGRVAALFAGTDGTDGPTDAAGGFADAHALDGMVEAARAALDNNDSYAALERAGALLRTGPTLTNVMDLTIMCVRSQTGGA